MDEKPVVGMVVPDPQPHPPSPLPRLAPDASRTRLEKRVATLEKDNDSLQEEVRRWYDKLQAADADVARLMKFVDYVATAPWADETVREMARNVRNGDPFTP
jgi:predicted GTPase